MVTMAIRLCTTSCSERRLPPHSTPTGVPSQARAPIRGRARQAAPLQDRCYSDGPLPLYCAGCQVDESHRGAAYRHPTIQAISGGVRMSDEPERREAGTPRPDGDDPDAWRTFWQVQGQPWRTEPE